MSVNYKMYNRLPHCSWDFDTGKCSRVEENGADVIKLLFYSNDGVHEVPFDLTLYGLQTTGGELQLNVSGICDVIRAEVVYELNGTHIASSNPLRLGSCLPSNSTGQPCSNHLDCQPGLFCLDSDSDSRLDVCQASSTSYGSLCELYGVGYEERISLDGSCKLAYPGSRNRNVPDGLPCLHYMDCISGHCWDVDGDSQLECSPSTTNGNSTGIMASDEHDCSPSSCFWAGRCYSNGTTISPGGASMTCMDGFWYGAPVPGAPTLPSVSYTHLTLPTTERV